MPVVRVEITRYTDDDPPGWVECRITDINGREWVFEEKAPIVTAAGLDADSDYPQWGAIDCEVRERSGDAVRVIVDARPDSFECEVPSDAVIE
jgi:hypothetical protein